MVRETGWTGGTLRVSIVSTTASSGATTADPRVEIGVQNVDKEIHEHIDEGDDEHAALHHLVIVPSGGTDDDGADTGEGKDLLDDDGTADQAADADAGEG